MILGALDASMDFGRTLTPALDAGSSIAQSVERGVGFSTILARFGDRFDGLDDNAQARVAAEEFVASSLILPVLKQLRETNDAWGPFAPGSYEKTFGSLMDGEVASQISRASNFPLIDQLAQDLRRMSASAVRLQEARRADGMDAGAR